MPDGRPDRKRRHTGLRGFPGLRVAPTPFRCACARRLRLPGWKMRTGRACHALRIDESITVAATSSHHDPRDDCRQELDSCWFSDPKLSGREPVEQRASDPFGCVLDMLPESICVARFAAETSLQSDRAATAASRVSHALARLMEEGQPRLQHGLERWLVRRVWRYYPVPNRGTRETPDTYFLSNPMTFWAAAPRDRPVFARRTGSGRKTSASVHVLRPLLR